MRRETYMKKATAFALVLLLVSSFAFAAGSSEKTPETSSKVVKLGVCGAVHEVIWAPTVEKLAKEGIDLQLVQFSDYVTPNNALANGEIDLNAFQHRIFLESEIKNKGYKIQNVGNTFIAPLNLFSYKVKSVSDLKAGDTIAIPNDVTNGGRAYKVLAAAGLITLKPDAGFNPTKEDIASYNVDVKILELAANTIPSALNDVTAAIINGNFAIDFGLKSENVIFEDTSVTEPSYWNLIAAKTADLSDPAKKELYKKVVKTFQSQETLDVFNTTFGGFYLAAGWDEDLLK